MGKKEFNFSYIRKEPKIWRIQKTATPYKSISIVRWLKQGQPRENFWVQIQDWVFPPPSSFISFYPSILPSSNLSFSPSHFFLLSFLPPPPPPPHFPLCFFMLTVHFYMQTNCTKNNNPREFQNYESIYWQSNFQQLHHALKKNLTLLKNEQEY